MNADAISLELRFPSISFQIIMPVGFKATEACSIHVYQHTPTGMVLFEERGGIGDWDQEIAIKTHKVFAFRMIYILFFELYLQSRRIGRTIQ